MKYLKKDKNKYFLSFFVVLFFGLTFFVNPLYAVTGEYSENPGTNNKFQIVPDCEHQVPGTDTVAYDCGWNDLLKLVRNIMAFMLYISATLAVLSFSYAGFLYLTAFGEMGKIEQAHGIFSKVIVGFLFVFLGWLIVATILKTLGVQSAFSLINFNQVTSF